MTNKQQQWNNIITDYQEKNNIEVKCLSDRVMLYCRYVIDKLDEQGLYKQGVSDREYNGQDYVDITYKEYYSRKVHTIYSNVVRGNIDFNGISPRVIACGIIYCASVLCGTPELTQVKVAELLGVAVLSVRKAYMKMRPYL